MRHRLLLVLAIALSPCASSTALAGALIDATLTIRIANVAPVAFAAPDATGLSVSDTLFQVDMGDAIAGAVNVRIAINPADPTHVVAGFPRDVPLPPIFWHVHIFGNQTGVFSGASPGAVAGAMRLDGDHGDNPTGTFFPLVFGESTTSQFSAPAECCGSELIQTLTALPWTVGSAVITNATTVTPDGAIVTGVTRARIGNNGLTPGGGGTILLVTPMTFTVRDGVGGSGFQNLAFADLELTFVPEPATALLCGTGLAALGLLGAHRRVSRGTRRPRRRVYPVRWSTRIFRSKEGSS